MQSKTKLLGILLVVICLASSLMLAGCGSNNNSSSSSSNSSSSTNSGSSNTSATTNDSDKSDSATTETTEENTPSEWQQFLDDYDAWVDSYVVFVDRYVQNPTDSTLVSEYSTLSSQTLDWASRAKDLEKSLSPEEASEYFDRANAIVAKLNAASQRVIEAVNNMQ